MKFIKKLLFLFLYCKQLINSYGLKQIIQSKINQTLLVNNDRIVNYEIYPADYYKMFSKRLFELETNNTCNESTCNLTNGKCFNNTVCKCMLGYANAYNSTNTNLSFCSYKLKSQLNAFLLETFTLIGGDLYLEHYSYAVIKGILFMIFLLIILIDVPCKFCGIKVKESLDSQCLPCIFIKTGTFIFSIFGLVIWEISDLIRIMSYNVTDKNSMPLVYFF